jgi:thiol oxidase
MLPTPVLLFAVGAMSSKAMSQPFVVAVDGRAARSELSSKQWLVQSPKGAYTTARTCGEGTRIFEWDMHVERTAASAAAMLSGGSSAAAAPPAGAEELMSEELMSSVGTAAALRPRLDESVAAAVRAYRGIHPGEGELKVTVLVSWQTDIDVHVTSSTCERAAKSPPGAISHPRSSVHVHIGPLPPIPPPPIRVEVRGSPRSNAAAKDSSWVAERAPLEALLRPDFNELLLATGDGQILEGSQTNFFVLQDGGLVTAGEGVLAGTVRRLVLEVCEREGVPVTLRPPRLDDCSRWDAAFVSSTSRLLLPVNEIYTPEEGRPSTDADLKCRIEYLQDSLALRLRDMVEREVRAHSVEIPMESALMPGI